MVSGTRPRCRRPLRRKMVVCRVEGFLFKRLTGFASVICPRGLSRVTFLITVMLLMVWRANRWYRWVNDTCTVLIFLGCRLRSDHFILLYFQAEGSRSQDIKTIVKGRTRTAISCYNFNVQQARRSVADPGFWDGAPPPGSATAGTCL